MDASIVIAIVALIVEVIGVLVAITTAAKSKAFLWRIMAVLLTLLLISTIGYVIYETSRDDPSPKVTITDPQTGAYNVGWRVTVRGTAEHIDPGATLWLVIRPENGKLYPQNTPPIVQQNDEWSGICLLGTDEESEIGNQFEIFVVIANESAEDRFEDYIARAQLSGYTGYEQWPEGVTPLTSIIVTK